MCVCVCHPSPWPGGRGGGRGGSSVSLGEGRRKHECACVCLFQLLETCLQLRAQGAQTLMHGYHPPLALIFICVRTEQNRLARSNDEHVMIRGPQRFWQAEQASAAEANTHTHTLTTALQPVDWSRFLAGRIVAAGSCGSSTPVGHTGNSLITA